ncbi:MAG: hypothetical protein JXQ29_17500 [Planctomycetes bacterium]|nr:hypothetical protein [Planctomycetota bacterium]
MHRRATLAVAFLALVASRGHSQTTLQVPSTPVTPGVPFPVVLINNTPICIDVSVTNVLTLLQPGGELIAPALVGCGPVGSCLANGAKASLSYTAPATGPGSSGSFVLLCPHGSGAAARIDVGPASAGFPDIHAYPTAIPHGPGGHHIAFPAGGSEWEFANTASQPRVISPTLRIFTPGGSVPAASTSFPSLTVPAGGVARVSLPLAGLAAGPYTVQADWIDPGAPGPVSVRHGIEFSTGTIVDLHFPGGRVLPRKGAISARIAVPRPSPFAPGPWPYVLAVGYQPGTTSFPGGVIAPVALDPLVVGSVVNGVNGLLTANVGTTSSASVYCAHSVTYFPVAPGIGIAHPGPVLSGLRLRVGALAIDPGNTAFAASQPEELTLQ